MSSPRDRFMQGTRENLEIEDTQPLNGSQRGRGGTACFRNVTLVVLSVAAICAVCLHLKPAPQKSNVLKDPNLALIKTESPATVKAAPLDGPQVASLVNQFGWKLLSAIHEGNGQKNIFISPLSIVSALGMALLGATPDGKAEHELLAAIGLSASSAPSFLSGLHKMTTDLMTVGNGVQFLNANSLWCKSSIKDSYISSVRETFDAEANLLPREPGPINEWCSKATEGMISNLLDEIKRETVAILLNAVYFKGVWQIQFKKEASIRGTFQSRTKGELPCAMMTRTDKNMLYAERDGMQIVELPYGADGKLRATVLLPPTGADALGKLVAELAAEGGSAKLTKLLSQVSTRKVELQLPRFKLDFGVHDLKKELSSSFGVREAFQGSNGFQKLSDEDVKISQVLHKAVIEVNEQGTKAAAATAVVISKSLAIMDEPLVQVVVDRPFCFLVRDPATGMLLFSGVVQDPQLDTKGV